MQLKVVIVSGARTAIGNFMGALEQFSPVDLRYFSMVPLERLGVLSGEEVLETLYLGIWDWALRCRGIAP